MASPQLSLTSFFSSYLTPAGKRAAWNLFWMLVGTGVSQICMFVAILILTRRLGRDQFGILATGLAMQGYITLLGSGGMPLVAIREMIRRPQDRSRIASTFIYLSCALGLTGASIAMIIVINMRIQPIECQAWTTLALGAAIASANPAPLFDTLHRQHVPALVLAGIDILFVAAIVGLNYAGPLSLFNVTILLALKWAVNVLTLGLLFHREVPITPAYAKLEEGRYLLQASWPILLGHLLYTGWPWSAVLLTRSFRGAQDAAIIGLAVQAFQAFTTVVALAHRLVRPHIHGPYGKSFFFITKLAFFYAAFTGLWFTVAAVLLYTVVQYLLPPEFSATAQAGLFLLVSGVILGTTNIIVEYVLAADGSTYLWMPYASASLTFVLGSAVVIPGYGITGAATLFLSSSWIALLVACLICAAVYVRDGLPTIRGREISPDRAG